MKTSVLALALCLSVPAIPALAATGPTGNVGSALTGIATTTHAGAKAVMHVSIPGPGGSIGSVTGSGHDFPSRIDVSNWGNFWNWGWDWFNWPHHAPLPLAGGLPALLLLGSAMGLASRARRR